MINKVRKITKRGSFPESRSKFFFEIFATWLGESVLFVRVCLSQREMLTVFSPGSSRLGVGFYLLIVKLLSDLRVSVVKLA
jgi:hypothetical protein